MPISKEALPGRRLSAAEEDHLRRLLGWASREIKSPARADAASVPKHVCEAVSALKKATADKSKSLEHAFVEPETPVAPAPIRRKKPLPKAPRSTAPRAML